MIMIRFLGENGDVYIFMLDVCFRIEIMRIGRISSRGNKIKENK